MPVSLLPIQNTNASYQHNILSCSGARSFGYLIYYSVSANRSEVLRYKNYQRCPPSPAWRECFAPTLPPLRAIRCRTRECEKKTTADGQRIWFEAFLASKNAFLYPAVWHIFGGARLSILGMVLHLLLFLLSSPFFPFFQHISAFLGFSTFPPNCPPPMPSGTSG